MTKEETIAYFKEHNESLVSFAKNENVYDYDKQVIEADYMRRCFEANENAIKALEQQSSEGVEVIRMGKNTVKARQGRFVVYDVEWLKEHFNTTETMLYGVPSEDYTSKESVIEWLKDKDIIKTKKQEENARRELAELPSVTPSYNSIKSELEQTRPKGKWKILDECANEGVYCSKCHKTVFKLEFSHTMKWRNFKYCPNCGAKMEVEE